MQGVCCHLRKTIQHNKMFGKRKDCRFAADADDTDTDARRDPKERGWSAASRTSTPLMNWHKHQPIALRGDFPWPPTIAQFLFTIQNKFSAYTITFLLDYTLFKNYK